MNSKAILLLAVAIFAGVFGALQADHYLRTRHDSRGDQTIALIPPPVIQTSLDQGTSGMLDFRAAAKKVVPSVVSVDRYERTYDLFGQESDIQETGTGSGVIVSKDGVIVTNNHVVADENGDVVPEVKVRLNDKRSFRAKVIGNDPRSDIAVLKIDAHDLTPIELGTSSNVEIGQWVMAVGNPLGFDDTVSVGVVSSLKRNLPVGASGIVDAIQTDAAINPGNSGGALTDQTGRLIGINAAIASRTGGSVGIGFAIPIDRVRAVANDIIKYGHARYGSLGISYRRDWEGILGDEDIRQQVAQRTGGDNVPDSGILIAGVAGPAARAGMKPLDILLSIDGIPTGTSFDLNRALIPKKPGDKVTIKWWSQGKIKSATVALQESGGTIQ